MTETVEFDTPAWRAQRDAALLEWIGDQHAVDWVVGFADACELFDDVIDKDKDIDPRHTYRVLDFVFVDQIRNPFYRRYCDDLATMVEVGIQAWHDANLYEQGGDAHEEVFAYVLRDWYMELLSLVIRITRGRDYLRAHSVEIRRFFTGHESLDDYRRKLHERRR